MHDNTAPTLLPLGKCSTLLHGAAKAAAQYALGIARYHEEHQLLYATDDNKLLLLKLRMQGSSECGDAVEHVAVARHGAARVDDRYSRSLRPWREMISSACDRGGATSLTHGLSFSGYP